MGTDTLSVACFYPADGVHLIGVGRAHDRVSCVPITATHNRRSGGVEPRSESIW